jgi:hypothetical protein
VQDYWVTVSGVDVILDTTVIHRGAGVTHTVYTLAITADVEYTATILTHSLYGPIGSGTSTAKTAAGGLTVAAKSFGGSGSPANYYQTGGGSVIGDSPLNWSGLIPATGSGDVYEKMTLVFCVYPVALGDTDARFIFGAEGGMIIVRNEGLAGGIQIGAENFAGQTKLISSTPTGSPSDYGGLIPGQWNSIMIAYDGDASTSPQGRNVEIWANGSEVFNGDWGSVTADNQPMAWAGYCWVGWGDSFFGASELGMECYLSFVWCKEEYLDPATYWSTFFNASNKPMDLGATGSGPTGGQPDTYCPDGDFTANVGSGANWDEIGTVPAAPSSPSD